MYARTTDLSSLKSNNILNNTERCLIEPDAAVVDSLQDKPAVVLCGYVLSEINSLRGTPLLA